MKEFIFNNEQLTPTTKLLLLFMIDKSQNGKKTVYCSREDYACSLHVSSKSITIGLKQLEKLNLIKKVKNKTPFDRTLHFEVVKEAL